MAIFWLLAGAFFWIGLVIWVFIKGKAVSYQMEDTAFRMIVYAGFFGLLYTIIPIGMLKRKKWGFYGGLALSALSLLGFPLGTILGIITIKAFADAKSAFGVI